MSTTDEILTELRSHGVRIRLGTPGKLRLAPARAINSALLERVREQKAALLAALRAQREQAEIDRITRLDAERREADRQTRRGYDFDPTAPGHADYLPPTGHPAFSILETCQRAGVALRIDPENGDLVVGKAGAKAEEPTQPWADLVRKLEAHVEAVARLVESGWTLTAEFPKEAAV